MIGPGTHQWTGDAPDDELGAVLARKLEAVLGGLAPALVPVLLPVVLDALRQVPASSGTTAPERALLTVTEAARRLGIGRTTTFALIGDGTLRSVTVGRRRLVPRWAIDEYVASLTEAKWGASSTRATSRA